MGIGKRIVGVVCAVVFLLLLGSGIFADVASFIEWLVMLDCSKPSLSLVGDIVVRALTFIVSFGLVGLIFEAIGWFSSRPMKVAYLIISTLASFALSYVVWQIEEHVILIIFITSILSAVAMSSIIIIKIAKKRNDNEKGQEN